MRGGTAKRLTRCRPAPGEVRATGVMHATTAVVHPWLPAEVRQVRAALPAASASEVAPPVLAEWAPWRGHAPPEPLPPLRLILIWDNRAGHLSWAIVRWLLEHGVMPLDTPLGGSWLNMAASLHRSSVTRARAGHHPQSAAELIPWLAATVAGGNAAPPPFVWDGTRRERRTRARHRRLGGSGAALADPQLFAA